ncbi:ATP-binding protein [Pseudoalteromonas sp. NZS127_1]|uniref:retron Eco8 family effector endonuclease n=1 Tax=Pseudoalteromonas sp. NZS127_1 TaxID=2792074 RepID=UPI0018CE75DA|nr:retron Eco8 family effector endonuclease [Pseudoalteromonas sp. NZS127_1]MBG9994658.1 ATP-binding protein [Pseudoalteromonas sp. NZS127_1]
MGIKRIKISNLLSFKLIEINDLLTINCTLGRNNAGKSNIFKLINFYYKALEEERCLSPELNSNYDSAGFIEITFDTTYINKLVHAQKNHKNKYFAKVRRALFSPKRCKNTLNNFFLLGKKAENDELVLKLTIKNDGTHYFSDDDRELRKVLLDIFPLFEIDSRHLDLHNWNELWHFLGKLRPFNAVDFQNELNEMLEDNDLLKTYKKNIEEVNKLSNTIKYSYKDKIVNYLKVGLSGDKFEFEGFELSKTSDGTNSYNHIITVCRLVSYLSKRTYQTPIVYIDEPELGLHPKMNERLIHDLSEILEKCYTTASGSVLSSPRPKFIFSTHSPNIVKQVIKNFSRDHRIFHFSKSTDHCTKVSSANSNYSDKNFLCNFSDNEARLFFSSFIFFVEGETEKELFENDSLARKFPHLIGVDVYQASDESVSKRITPDFVNTDVPYRFLFDADKGINIYKSGKTQKHHLKYKRYGSTLDLTPEVIKRQKNKSCLGFSKKNRELNYLTRNFLEFNDKEILLSELHLKVLRPNSLIPFYKDANILLAKQNCILVSTTIEGSLINLDAREIFYSWLSTVRGVDMEAVLTKINKSKYFDDDDLIQYFRIIFNGKSETLINYKNFKKRKLNNARSTKFMNWLEKCTVRHSDLGKTDGWVTSFLDYSINYIEKKSLEEKVHFSKLFSNYFKELYGIITQLRYGS